MATWSKAKCRWCQQRCYENGDLHSQGQKVIIVNNCWFLFVSIHITIQSNILQKIEPQRYDAARIKIKLGSRKNGVTKLHVHKYKTEQRLAKWKSNVNLTSSRNDKGWRCITNCDVLKHLTIIHMSQSTWKQQMINKSNTATSHLCSQIFNCICFIQFSSHRKVQQRH